MEILIIFISSFLILMILNYVSIKTIYILDKESLGLSSSNISYFRLIKHIYMDKKIFLKLVALSLFFILTNSFIVFKILKEFSIVMINIYIKYYILFIILYIFALIDYLTYYIYSILSYPAIFISVIFFISNLFLKGILKERIETLFLIGLFYILINKLKFLGEGDFDIFLIISLILGAGSTLFIFYVSIILCGIVGLIMLIKKSSKCLNNKLPFIPFVFASIFLFIFISI